MDIRLAIVDDHLLFRKALSNYLAEQVNIRIVINVPDLETLVDKLKHYSIDVLLLDILLPGPVSYETIKKIQLEYPRTKILILSMCNDLGVLSDLLDLGVHGCVSKADDPEELFTAINTIATNKIYRNKLFTDALYYNRQSNIQLNARDGNVLNDREKKILQLIWEEKSNKEIADHFFLSIRSIEKIRQDIKDKLNLKSTIGLLKYAIRKRIVDINSLENNAW
jgi:DNA-binding NarL/FixJ family response regulator